MGPLPAGLQLLASVKAVLALGALALLIWDWKLGPAAPPRWSAFQRRALAAIGLLAVAAWWNFGAMHGRGRLIHLHDAFHYYIGSKYFGELGYTRIYQCAAVAEVQRGRVRQVEERWTRNLATNNLEHLLPGPTETADCVGRFDPSRWKAFTDDVEWFRRTMRGEAYDGIFLVFGHNATPAWNAMGHWLIGSTPASQRQLLRLALIDSLLLAIMWLVVWRTFGWPSAAVAAVWWGLSEVTAYNWVGGGLVRQDALFCIVMAVCALRTNRRTLAGAALATAALLRAFPLFLLAGLAIKLGHTVYQRGVRQALDDSWRFAAGAALAGTLILGFTSLTWRTSWDGALTPWSAFATNSRKHLETPITNHVGLKPALWFSPATRAAEIADLWLEGPWDTWRRARTETFESRKALFYPIAGLFVILFAWAIRRVDDWIALVASVALLPFVTTLANYYYSVLLVFGLLWAVDKPIGIGLAGLSALTAILPAFVGQRDDRHVVISAAVVLFAFFVAARIGRWPQQTAEPVPLPPVAPQPATAGPAPAITVSNAEESARGAAPPSAHLARVRPWHLPLGPAVLALYFLRDGRSGATPATIVWPLVATLLLVAGVWALMTLATRRARRSALLVTLLLFATAGYGAVSGVGLPGLVPAFYVMVLIAAAGIWWVHDRRVPSMTAVVNVALAVGAAALLILNVRDEYRLTAVSALEVPAPLPRSSKPAAELPDIYVLILEGYGRADVLRDRYGFDNPLVQDLRSLGFFVADRAAANYPQMGQALASGLNLAYLPDLLTASSSDGLLRRRFGNLIARNRFFAALDAAGYRIRSYDSEYALARPSPTDERRAPLLRFTNFEYRTYEATAVPRVLQAAGLERGLIPKEVHRRHVRWVLDRLADEPVARDGAPALVFAHVLAPHPPFALQPDGSARATRAAMAFNDGDQWHRLTRGTGERYESGYLDGLKYLNSRVPAIVRGILARSTRPTVIYIQSDHGPGSSLRWDRPDPESLRERLGILLAVRMPDGNHAPFHDRITPVNGFRALLSRALGADLPPLEDRSFYTPWEKLKDFTDVTADNR